MGYVAEPLTRLQLRSLALQLRAVLSLEGELYFPVMQLLECVMPLLFEGFHYEVVELDELSANRHAETDVANRCIRIREDIYYRAATGHGRDRMTIMHEIAHYILLVVLGVKFGRAFGDAKAEAFRDPEWQAKALVGELMCPVHLIGDLTDGQVAHECGVSLPAARYNLKMCKGGDAY